jgi:hypothetical protein
MLRLSECNLLTSILVHFAGPSGRAVSGEGLDRLDAEIVCSNPA